jgi:hypothetical protein
MIAWTRISTSSPYTAVLSILRIAAIQQAVQADANERASFKIGALV